MLLGGVELLLLAARIGGESRPSGGIGAAGLDLMDVVQAVKRVLEGCMRVRMKRLGQGLGKRPRP